MKPVAVIGLGFGDEGKGMMVSALANSRLKTLVVRYCGGQQAGHQVVMEDGREHVFSNFGSGTLHGADTYWSSFCTLDPIGVMNEWDALPMEKTGRPLLYINPACPVTTPYEKGANLTHEYIFNHGTCGVGVGATHEREESHFHLWFKDLFHPSVLRIKLEMIRKGCHIQTESPQIDEFLSACAELVELAIPEEPSFLKYKNVIFEGSQGLLLDQDIGFFPHVTRSSTGTKNILEILNSYNFHIILVTRAYQTRHGAGPMTNEHLPCPARENPREKNLDTGIQGKFRRTVLDMDLLRYAVDSDLLIRRSKDLGLAITCLDLMSGYQLTSKGKVIDFPNERAFVDYITHELAASNVFLSRDPYPRFDWVYKRGSWVIK